MVNPGDEPQRNGDTEFMMEIDLKKLDTITEKIIGCAIEVHRILGPGL